MTEKTISSDLRRVLDNIDKAIELYADAINLVTQRFYAMGIAVECITLSLKLAAMLERWRVYLPFHECIDVRFDWWNKKLTRHLYRLKGSARASDQERLFYPQNQFWTDLIDKLPQFATGEFVSEEETQPQLELGVIDRLSLYSPRYADSELQTDVKEYVQRMDARLDELENLDPEEEEEWMVGIDKAAMATLKQQYNDQLRVMYVGLGYKQRAEFEDMIAGKVRNYVETVLDDEAMDLCMVSALKGLTEVLKELYDFFRDDHRDVRYRRLTLRLYYELCRDDLDEAENEGRSLRTKWAPRMRKANARKKVAAIVEDLKASKWGDKLMEYIEDFAQADPFGDASLGRFLFANRHELTEEDAKRIIVQLQEIKWLTDNVINQQTTGKTTIPRLNAEDQKILTRALKLLEEGTWMNGMTADKMKAGLSAALGQSDMVLNEAQQKMSKELWQMFRSRERLGDAERSFIATFLNIIGWCERDNNRFIQGRGPALCKVFFKNGGYENAFKSIDKAKKAGAVKSFDAIVPLLEECLRV